MARDPNHTVPSVELQGKALKCTEEVKLLGVILDKKLTFQSHIEAVEKRASKALGALMMVGKTEKINPANMIKLYKSLVVPHLEYAASVWQIGECDKLEKIQRKGLAPGFSLTFVFQESLGLSTVVFESPGANFKSPK